MVFNVPCPDSGPIDIRPVFCGYEDCEKGHSYGPAVRDSYLIHCVVGGRGEFCCGKRYELTKGKCFLICPGEVTFYRADGNDPWRYVWAAFRGETAGRLLRGAGLDGKSPILENGAVAGLFEQLYRELKEGTFPSGRAEIALAAFLFSLFSALPFREDGAETQPERYVKKAAEYLGAMYCSRVTVEELARYCGLERHYLSRIFKARTGVTPQERLIALRMDRAKELLRTSPLSVGDISRSVGYGDAYLFSKMFKKTTGVSPLRYRRQGG